MFGGDRLVARVSGRYQITGTVVWQQAPPPNVGTFRQLWIRRNGNQFIAVQTNGPILNTQGQTVTTLFELAEDDYVQLVVDQDSGGPLDVLKFLGDQEAVSPEFMMVKV
jgi:hypothetical protein